MTTEHCPHCTESAFEIRHRDPEPTESVTTCDVCGVRYGWDETANAAVLYAAAEGAQMTARRRKS